jgi:hypothetical protein
MNNRNSGGRPNFQGKAFLRSESVRSTGMIRPCCAPRQKCWLDGLYSPKGVQYHPAWIVLPNN